MRGYAIDASAEKAAGENPCFKCSDRFAGCHSDLCPHGYLGWVERRQTFRNEAKRLARLETDADAVYFDGRARALRSKGKKVADGRR